jgi:hypothetical protein
LEILGEEGRIEFKMTRVIGNAKNIAELTLTFKLFQTRIKISELGARPGRRNLSQGQEGRGF